MTNSSTAETISTVLVPLGDLDYFSARRFTDAAAAHMAGAHPHDSVTVDLSAVPFCDSAVASLMDWVDGLADELDVDVVTGPAVERVLGLLANRRARHPRSLVP